MKKKTHKATVSEKIIRAAIERSNKMFMDVVTGSKEDIVRVLRVVEYIGPRELVDQQIAASLHGERRVRTSQGHEGGVLIRAATVGVIPGLAIKADRDTYQENATDRLLRQIREEKEHARRNYINQINTRTGQWEPYSYEPS